MTSAASIADNTTRSIWRSPLGRTKLSRVAPVTPEGPSLTTIGSRPAPPPAYNSAPETLRIARAISRRYNTSDIGSALPTAPGTTVALPSEPPPMACEYRFWPFFSVDRCAEEEPNESSKRLFREPESSGTMRPSPGRDFASKASAKVFLKCGDWDTSTRKMPCRAAFCSQKIWLSCQADNSTK